MDNACPARHVGVIMDGNGRWARARGLPRSFGHKQGAKAFGNVVRHAARIGLAYLTVYAFSTENWSRPPDEVAELMNLLRNYLADMERYKKDNIRVRIIGDMQPLDPDIRSEIARLERESASNTGLCLNIALSYGGRDEVVHAVRAMIEAAQEGALTAGEVDEAKVSEYLYTAGQPDVDLIIRTSGEQRISNFLLWQGAYAEYVFTDVLWPDFKPRDFDAALAEFAARSRRMGGL